MKQKISLKKEKKKGMEINETRKGKYSKIILKEKKTDYKKKKQNKEQKMRKKTYNNEKIPT
jgi:hypothetical protein